MFPLKEHSPNYLYFYIENLSIFIFYLKFKRKHLTFSILSRYHSWWSNTRLAAIILNSLVFLKYCWRCVWSMLWMWEAPATYFLLSNFFLATALWFFCLLPLEISVYQWKWLLKSIFSKMSHNLFIANNTRNWYKPPRWQNTTQVKATRRLEHRYKKRKERRSEYPSDICERENQ